MKQAMQVLTSRETVEWLTPPWLVDMAREVLGVIELDPATCAKAQEWIQAERYYTVEDDGLAQIYRSKTVWLNPPFDSTSAWVDKLIGEYDMGNVKEAILLVNANVGYRWFESLWRRHPVCLLRERVHFLRSDGSEAGQAKRAQAVFLLSDSLSTLVKFREVFGQLGKIVLP